MELKTKKKRVALVFTTRSLVIATDKLEGENFEEVFFKAMSKTDIRALAKIISAFGEDPEDGTTSFKKTEEVYDFIDEYKKENEKSYFDIFDEIAEAINEEGFFNRKMTAEELKATILNPLLGLDMNKLVTKSAEQAVTKIAEKEMMLEA